MANRPVRSIISCAVVSLFLLSFLWAGLQHGGWQSSIHKVLLDEFPPFLSGHVSESFTGKSQHVHLRTITADELALAERRLILVGDIHGMKRSLDKLLSKLSYNPSRDFLGHLGDFVAKGPDSLQVLSQFADANVTGVCGNHEQTVIEWRAWIEWVEEHHGGKDWLKKLERKYPHGLPSKKHKLKWAIPKKWVFMGEHYKIARHMTPSQYSYLKSLPLAIHLPSLHTLIAHAGILPFNPELPLDAPEQPLAHTPVVSSSSSHSIRSAQERALLTDVKQNTDPWVLLNMRTVLRNGDVSRKVDEGTPWPELWDMTMEQCHGYHDGPTEGPGLENQDDLAPASLHLSCYPINIVYGHFASRGLDIMRWSFGLDDGCVKGRHLSAMVISHLTDFKSVTDAQVQSVPFGDNGMAQIVSIRCPKHGPKSSVN